MHICQPALSRQIRDLETELEVRLFDRVGRRLQLTAEGDDLLRVSRHVLAQAESLVERARSLGSGGGGVLRIGATSQAMQSVLAGFLPKFQRAHPGVDIRLTEQGGVRLYDLVERGELHLALSGILPGHVLESRPLFPIRVLAVTTRGPRWKRRTTIDVAELAGEPVLLLTRDFGSRQLFDAACRIARIQPRVVLESREPHSLVTLAEAGQGIAVVPSTVRFASTRVQIAPLLQGGKSLGAWGGLAWDPRRALPTSAPRFIEDLAVHIARNVPGRRFDRIAPPLPPR